MKTLKWITIGTSLLLLVASLAGNAWLAATLRVYRYNVNHGWFTYSHEGQPRYPIDGLTSADLKNMLDVIDKEDGEATDRRILWLEVLDSNRVEITTGRLTGSLGGGGRFFRFNRTDKGWELDKKRHGLWVA